MTTMANPDAPSGAGVPDIDDASTASLEPADRMTRLGAAILDSIIFTAMVYGPIWFVAYVAGAGGDAARRMEASTGVLAFGLLLMLVSVTAWCWLTIRFVRRNGQSIGKKMLDIKVVRRDGSPASLARIFWLRNVPNAVLSVIPYLRILATIDILFIFTESQQCLHDKIADTIVINA